MTIDAGPGCVPRLEHGADRAGQLCSRVRGERDSGPVAIEVFEARGESLEVICAKLDVELDP